MSGELKVREILIGERDREEMGNLRELADSIASVGMLHPVVVTKDRELIAGGRRLAAAALLGWASVPVTTVTWFDVERALRAEADENTCRKGLTPYEASRMRERRIKALNNASVIRKPGRPARESNSSKLEELAGDAPTAQTCVMPAPKTPSEGDARKVGAKTTGYSGSTLDKVDKIRDVAERGVIRKGKEEVPAPEPVVEVAKKALEDVKRTGAAVDRSSRDLNAAVEAYVGADPDVQRARLAKNFADAMGRALDVVKFDPETVAAVMDSDDWDTVELEFEAIAKFWQELKSHRTQGLRLVGGTHV